MLKWVTYIGFLVGAAVHAARNIANMRFAHRLWYSVEPYLYVKLFLTMRIRCGACGGHDWFMTVELDSGLRRKVRTDDWTDTAALLVSLNRWMDNYIKHVYGGLKTSMGYRIAAVGTEMDVRSTVNWKVLDDDTVLDANRVEHAFRNLPKRFM